MCESHGASSVIWVLSFDAVREAMMVRARNIRYGHCKAQNHKERNWAKQVIYHEAYGCVGSFPIVPAKAQNEVGWECPACHKRREKDGHDPCLGKLPGVKFACCGHGGQGDCEGYIFFTNGKIIRFHKLIEVSSGMGVTS